MVIQLIKSQLFTFLQFILQCVNYLKSFVIANVSTGYGSSAKVYKIILRYKPPERLDFSSIDDFLLLVEDFVHPEIVLKEDVSLYCINTHEAVFVDCGAKDVFDSCHHAFVYNAQFAISTKVICLPLASFYKVASLVELPSIPIIHLPNHGRCGSTILTRLFEAMPGTLSVSETNAFTDLAVLSQQGVVKREVLKEMCYAVIMCTVKHCNTRNSKLLFLKFQNIVTYVTDIMMEVVPEIKHIYMYRQPVAFVHSYEKLLFVNNWDPLNEEMCAFWSGLGYNDTLKGYPNYDHDYIKKLSSFSRFALIWITGIAAFNKLISNDYQITSLKYEDLVSNPKETLVSIFKYLSIDESFLPDVDKVMAKDSQAGSEYSSRNVDKKKLEASISPISKSLITEVNLLCQDFNIPIFWDDIHLDKNICNDP